MEPCCTSWQVVALVVHQTAWFGHYCTKKGTKHVALGNSLFPTRTAKVFSVIDSLTSHHSGFLHISPQRCGHVFITTWGKLVSKSLSSHAKHVSLGTRLACLLTPGWISRRGPKPRVCVRVPLSYYSLHSCSVSGEIFGHNRTKS